MHWGSARRDLLPQLSLKPDPLKFKMADAAQTCADMEEEISELAVQNPPQAAPGSTVSICHTEGPFPAFMESLIGHTMENLLCSPMGPNEAYSGSPQQPGLPHTDSLINTADLFHKLSELLDRGLSTTAAKITGEIKADFQNLGDRMETIEHKLDNTVAKINQNSDHIQVLQDHLDRVLSSIDDLENRSRRYK